MTATARIVSSFALAFVLLAGGASRQAHASAGGIGDLFITSDASNLVRAYGGISGTLLGTFTNSVSGTGELGIHFGATNGRVLVGSFGGGVDEFDASTGAYIKTYAPGGGWQWAAVYAPNGNVYVGSQTTGDIREYDSNTGAFVNVLCPFPGAPDMQYGLNGNLYICSYTLGGVREVDPNTGGTISQWPLPAGSQANDIAFLPSGDILVTAMGPNVMYRFDSAHVLVGIIVGAGWQRPHGVAISPHDGNIYVVDGVTTQVHVFDSTTFVELNPAFRNPGTGDKIVDLDFRPEMPTPAASTSWGRIKSLYHP